MKFFNAAVKPIHLSFKRDMLGDLKRGYPWVFADALRDRPQAAPGALAVIKDKNRVIRAKGLYDPTSPLAFRVCALLDDRLDDDLIAGRLEKAVAQRLKYFDKDTTAYRLINGEGDALPGLVVDRYADTLVFQLDGAGPHGFWNVDNISAWLKDRLRIKCCYLKGRGPPCRSLHGSKPSEHIECLEHAVRFAVDVINGQKTGFFLDQRENRLTVRQFSHQKTVLNLFGYTGGFSVYAGLGGAAHVTSVDSSKGAICASIENWALNGLSPSQHTAVTADVFEFLSAAALKKRVWDFIIVDPPSFASSSKEIERASAGYKRLIAAAAACVSDGGLLATSSCSSRISAAAFMEINREATMRSKRRAQVLTISGQPFDHPFPLACLELQYLKFFLMRVN